MTSVLAPLNNWAGSIYMVTGLGLVFAGGYSFMATLVLVIWLLVTGILVGLMFLFQFIYDSMLEGSVLVPVLVVVGCMIVGAAITVLI